MNLRQLPLRLLCVVALVMMFLPVLMLSLPLPVFVPAWGTTSLSVLLVIATLLLPRYGRPHFWRMRATRAAIRAGDEAWQRGDVAAAEHHYLRAVERAELLEVHHHHNVGIVLVHLGALYRSSGRYAEAEPVFRGAFRHLDEVLLAQHPHRVTVLNDWAVVCIQCGNYAAAEPLCRELLAIYRATPGPGAVEVPITLHNLALVHKGLGRYAEAETLLTQARELMAEKMDKGHPFAGWLLNNLADLRLCQGRLGEAETLARQGLALQEKSTGPDHCSVARCLTTLADIARRQGRAAEAQALCHRCLAVVEKALGPNHPDLSGSLATLARLAVTAGNYAEAEALYRRCLDIRERALLPEHRDRVEAMSEYVEARRLAQAAAETTEAPLRAMEAKPNSQAASP